MALPLLLPAVAGLAKRVIGTRGGVAGLAGLGGVAAGVAGTLGVQRLVGVRRRRRRARLTAKEMQELMFIRQALGRTAAANALPFFLGRGR